MPKAKINSAKLISKKAPCLCKCSLAGGRELQLLHSAIPGAAKATQEPGPGPAPPEWLQNELGHTSSAKPQLLQVTLVKNQSLRWLKKITGEGMSKNPDFPPTPGGDPSSQLKLLFAISPHHQLMLLSTHSGLFLPLFPRSLCPQRAFLPFLGSLSMSQGSARHPLPAKSLSHAIPSHHHATIYP